MSPPQLGESVRGVAKWAEIKKTKYARLAEERKRKQLEYELSLERLRQAKRTLHTSRLVVDLARAEYRRGNEQAERPHNCAVLTFCDESLRRQCTGPQATT